MIKRYTIQVRRSATKELRRLPKKEVDKIAQLITKLAVNPRPAGCKKLQGEDNMWRLRSGNYRVLYTVDDGKVMIEVVSVRHRKDVYR